MPLIYDSNIFKLIWFSTRTYLNFVQLKIPVVGAPLRQVSLESDGKFLAVVDDRVVAIDKESSLSEFFLDIKDCERP